MKMVFDNMYSFMNSYARIFLTIVTIILLVLLRFVSCTREGTNNPFAPVEDSFLQFESLKIDRDYVAPNGDKAVVKAIVKDALGKRASGKTVEFSVRLGKITVSAMTDTQGVAQVDYSSGTESGRDTIFAFIQRPKRGTVWDTTFIEIQAQASLSLAAVSPVLADGESKSDVSVIIRNERNNPVSGAVVKFTSTMGSIPGSAQTDANGSVKVSLTSERRNGTAVVKAEYNSLKDSIEVMFTGVTITMTATPSTLMADGTSWSALRVEVKDAKNLVIQGEPVIVTSLFSEIQKPQGRTNAAGVFIDSVRSKHSAKDTIRARAAGAEGTVAVTYIGYQLELSSTKSSISARTDTALITALLLDTKGTIVPYATVRFSTSLGRFTRIDSITAPDGVARAWFVSDEIGSAEITAEAVVAGSIAQAALRVEIQAQLRLTLSAVSPIQSDGISASRVTIALRNEKNNPISGATITFRTSMGTIPLSAQTNTSGLAEVNLISERRNGTALIRAEYNTIADSIEVLFTGVTVGVTATPDNLFADGRTWVGVHVQVKDAANLAIQGENVEVRSSLGSELKRGRGRTDAAGIFSDSVRSSSSGIDTLAVQAAGASGSAIVTYTGYRLDLSASPSTFTAQVETTTIQAVLFDNNNQIVRNVPISFATTIGEFIREDSVTNNNGNATASLISVGIGTADVTVEATVNTITIRKTIQVVIKSAKARKVQLQASPRVVRVNGGESVLSATVTDASGNPVPNTTVNYSVLLGPHGGETVNPPFASTNANGIATTKFISGSRSSDSTNDVRIQARIQSTQIISNVVTLTIAGAPDTIVLGYGQPVLGNGTYTLQISAIVSDINGNPVVDGTLVNFSTKPPIGIISSPITSAGGIASSNLIYPVAQAGSRITILVESSGISDSLVIGTLPGATGEVNSITIEQPSPLQVLGNGVDQAAIKALVADAQNNPIAQKFVEFVITYGSKVVRTSEFSRQIVDATGNPVTDPGRAIINLSIADSIDQYPLIIATSSGKTTRFNDDSSLVFKGINLQISTIKDTVSAGEQLDISILLKEKTSTVAIENASIKLGTSLGTITNTITTDAKGQATTTWNAGSITGTAKITVTYGATIQKSIYIMIKQQVPTDPKNIQLSVSDQTIQVRGMGGNESATITGTVTDVDNSPVIDGTRIIFETNRGEFPNLLKIDTIATQSGDAKITLRSDYTSGLVRISASDINHIIASSTILLTVQPGFPDSIELAADTNNVTQDGDFRTFQVIVVVKDAKRNPVIDGTMVSFTLDPTDPATITPAASPSVTADGIARATVRYDKKYASRYIGVLVSAIDKANRFYVKLPAAPPVQTVPDTVILSVDTSQVTNLGNGLRSIQVAGIVRTAAGNPVNDGTPVNFSIVQPARGQINSPVFTTGGVSTTTLTYTLSDRGFTITVTATSGAKSTNKSIKLP